MWLHCLTRRIAADLWLNKGYPIGFRLRRWALKIMSLMISINRLFSLTQSRRLYKVFQGKFLVTILPSPTTTPYRCELSSETIEIALDSALGDFYPSAIWGDDRKSFVNHLQASGQSELSRRPLEAHCPCRISYDYGNGQQRHRRCLPLYWRLETVLYNVQSLHQCAVITSMCSHYINVFNKVITKQAIATKGSHGKPYPGWFWPNLPSIDGQLRLVFMRAIRRQLLDDFKHHVDKKRARSNSDSSVGSDFPRVALSGVDRDSIRRKFKKGRPVSAVALP